MLPTTLNRNRNSTMTLNSFIDSQINGYNKKYYPINSIMNTNQNN